MKAQRKTQTLQTQEKHNRVWNDRNCDRSYLEKCFGFALSFLDLSGVLLDNDRVSTTVGIFMSE